MVDSSPFQDHKVHQVRPVNPENPAPRASPDKMGRASMDLQDCPAMLVPPERKVAPALLAHLDHRETMARREAANTAHLHALHPVIRKPSVEGRRFLELRLNPLFVHFILTILFPLFPLESLRFYKRQLRVH